MAFCIINLNTKTLKHSGSCLADRAKADQASLTVCQLHQAPGSHISHLYIHLVSIAHGSIPGYYIFDHAKHQKKRLLCHCLGIHPCTVADINPPFSCGSQVDPVKGNTFRMDQL